VRAPHICGNTGPSAITGTGTWAKTTSCGSFGLSQNIHACASSGEGDMQADQGLSRATRLDARSVNCVASELFGGVASRPGGVTNILGSARTVAVGLGDGALNGSFGAAFCRPGILKLSCTFEAPKSKILRRVTVSSPAITAYSAVNT